MSLSEIENAIRELPPEEARALLERVKDLSKAKGSGTDLRRGAMEKWRVRGGFAAGMRSDDYLRLVRDGDSR